MLSDAYITKTINKDKEYLMQMFLDCKLPDENLYLGKILKKHLDFENLTSVHKDVTEYFSKKTYLKRLSESDSYGRDIENFPKLCWLTEEYFNGKLRNPIGVHYNPRLKKNVIHPGGTRQRVFSLWHNEAVDCIYFNTGGIKFDWLEHMRCIDLLDIVSPNVFFALVADHGSLIPHIHFDQHSISTNVKLYQNLINSFLTKGLRFSINAKHEFFKEHFPNAKKSIEPSILIDFKSSRPSQTTLIKALIMICLQYEFNSKEFSISYLNDKNKPRKTLIL